MVRLKDKILEIRHINRLSQNDLVNRTGISQSTYSKYENGKTEIPLESVKLIAKALDVSPVELLQDELGLTDEEVKKYPLRIDEQIVLEAVATPKELTDILGKLNETLKDIAPILTPGEISVACSQLDLCKETLQQKKVAKSELAKTA